MRIRSFIFLIVIGLGLFPIAILTIFNFPKTLEKLEYGAELETQARSHVGFTQLNGRIHYLKKSLIRFATLPSTFAAINACSGSEALPDIVNRWFDEDEQVKGITLFNTDGIQLLSLQRTDKQLLPTELSENHKGHPFFNESLKIPEGQVFVELVDYISDPFQRTPKNEYELLVYTPVIDISHGIAGVMLMRIDMSQFLKNYFDSIWVTGDGHYVRECKLKANNSLTVSSDSIDTCNAFEKYPGLQNSEINSPVILPSGNNKKIAWMPLVFNSDQKVVMWVGSTVDQSELMQWEVTLTVNVIGLMAVMSLFVFYSANWISARIEYMQKDLLKSLDDIITKEKSIEFNWNGPLEIQNLSQDLTAFSERYSATCEARNLAEISLSESEDKFRNLTASALDGIILMDNEGYITYWNEAAATIFGYTPEEALQHPIHSLINPRRESDDLSVEPMERVGTGASVAKAVNIVARNSDDEDVYVELSLSSTTIKGKWHAIWIVRDISERKKNEEENRKQQQHLIQADKMISLGLLVSGVAHEINNPNSIALLNIPILNRSWESAKPILDEFYEENGDFAIAGVEYSNMRNQLPRISQELEESALRIKQIVADLKDYARQETTGQQVPVDITEVVKYGVRLTSNSIRKSTNNFVTNYAPQELMVNANRQRLTQVVVNLIQNSCEALENTDASLIISTRYNEEMDGIEISILDEGAGIPQDELKQVTDPFFTTKRSIGGTGLGLSVSAGIVKEHNGVMNFYSEVGKGTEVVIVFPALHTQIITEK